MSAGILDLRSPVVAIDPREWPTVPPEQLALLIPANGIYTLEQARIIRQIAATRWFLLRNNGPQGERWACSRCHGIHEFFTVHCLPVPMNGLTHALGLLSERVGDDLVFSCLELGAIEPVRREYALQLYEKLRGLGYTREQLLGD